MKNKYFLNGTLLGLFMVPLVAIYLVPLKVLGDMLSEWRFLLPVLVGYLAAVVIGRLVDRFIHRRGFIATVIVLVFVFLAGVFFGCAANFFANGEFLQRPEFGHRNQLWTWFVKPAYWFTVIGGPCAVVVAVVYYLGDKFYRRWRAKEGEL